MSKVIKILVVATAVAGSASSAFAASAHHRYNQRASTIGRYSDPPVFEQRYSAPYAWQDNGMTSRAGLVGAVGN